MQRREQLSAGVGGRVAGAEGWKRGQGREHETDGFIRLMLCLFLFCQPGSDITATISKNGAEPAP